MGHITPLAFKLQMKNRYNRSAYSKGYDLGSCFLLQ